MKVYMCIYVSMNCVMGDFCFHSGEIKSKQTTKPNQTKKNPHATTFHDDGNQTLEQVTQSSCGIPILGSIQNLTQKALRNQRHFTHLLAGYWIR